MTDQQPPPPAQATEPPPLIPPAQPPAGEWTPPASGAAAKPPSKVRTYIIGAVVVAVIAVGAYFISQNQNAGDLVIGQCFDVPARDTDITTVVKHACTEAHDAEVFHVVEYNEGDAYPIALSLDNFIDETCVQVFGTYLGEPFESASDYNLGYFYPDRDAWSGGDRTFTCYVTRADDAKLTQSVKAAASS